MRKFIQFITFLLLINSIQLVAQYSKQVFDKAPKPVFENLALDKNLPGSNPVLPHTATAILVGKMWNAYTTQASYTNQIFTDPFSGLIAVVHRVDRTGAGSGRIVYQGSDDGGQNWTPQIGPMNLTPWNLGRHPNLVLSNPTKSTTPGEQVPVAGWAELSSSWYWYQFAKDQTFGAGTLTQYIDSTYYPGDEMFVNNQGHVFAVVPLIDYRVEGTDTINNDLFKSTDGGATWTKVGISKTTDFNNDTWNGTKGFINKNGVGYIVVEGQKPGEDFYSFGYKKTTDDGATWDANWTWVNPFTIPPLAGNVHALNYEVDAIVDGQGNLHFAGTFVDTVGSGTGIYHIWGQGSNWQAQKIASVNRTSMSLPGGLSTLNEVEFATNYDGTIVVLKWCDVPTPNDTLYDVYMTPVYGASVNVQNITNTTAVHEKYSQMSAYGYMQDPTTFRVDCMYTVFGNGDTDDLAEAELWYLSGVTFQLTSVDDPVATPRFNLEQNYPNPFNPSTTIRFTIPERQLVTLKVYDMLGREITTLVNEVKDAGAHTIKYVAKDLPSGMYLYTITAGNYTSTKKMMLVK